MRPKARRDWSRAVAYDDSRSLERTTAEATLADGISLVPDSRSRTRRKNFSPGHRTGQHTTIPRNFSSTPLPQLCNHCLLLSRVPSLVSGALSEFTIANNHVDNERSEPNHGKSLQPPVLLQETICIKYDNPTTHKEENRSRLTYFHSTISRNGRASRLRLQTRWHHSCNIKSIRLHEVGPTDRSDLRMHQE